jgi:hypothetical protein
MFLRRAGKLMRPLTLLFLMTLAGGILYAAPPAAPSGPTLQFDYGQGLAHSNAVSKFMYFVPLVSPELISMYTNAGNSQCVRVVSFSNLAKAKTFQATCEFEFTGNGVLKNIFDNSPSVQRHNKELKAGEVIPHQIESISAEGTGCGTLEVEGILTNGQQFVTEVRMRFNSHGHISPINIELGDLTYHDGAIHYENEMVARVNTLTFRQDCTDPKMEVTLDSVKRKDAPDTLWQNFLGGVKGIAANAFLPPIRVTPEGNQTMMDFGQALAAEKKAFTFPFATRLKTTGVLPP